MVPPPPGRFVTVTLGTPGNACANRWITRAWRSAAPPAPEDTTTSTFFVGFHSCAVAALNDSTPARTSATRRTLLQFFFEPVTYGVDGEREIVALAVLCATFLGREQAESLVLRADRIDKLLRVGHRDLCILGAMQQQERATHFLGDTLEPEAF